jgi:hypothetical protein
VRKLGIQAVLERFVHPAMMQVLQMQTDVYCLGAWEVGYFTQRTRCQRFFLAATT